MAGAFDKYNPQKGPYKSSSLCPSCRGEFTIRTFSQASHYACPKCQRLINLRKFKAEDNIRFKEIIKKPLLELGQRAIFDNTDFEIVGIVYWKEARERFYWFEYTLFNPFAGYRTLSNVDGHWNLFERTSDYPRDISATKDSKTIIHDGREFKLYHRYHTELAWATGEFKWNIGKEPRPRCVEWISPPYMLSKEHSNSEIAWFIGKYLSPAEVEKAFKLTKSLPARQKVAPNQPFALAFDVSKLFSLSAIFIGLFIFTQIFIRPTEKEVFANKYYAERVDSLGGIAAKPIITESFQVEEGLFTTSNLEVQLYAEVDNSWAEAHITLVNEDTDVEYETEIGVEYYYGYAGNEHWTEGSKDENRLISEASPGRYHMIIAPYMEENKPPVALTVKVANNVYMWSNFWFILLALILFPLGVYLYQHNFEKRRWMNSEFSPYD